MEFLTKKKKATKTKTVKYTKKESQIRAYYKKGRTRAWLMVKFTMDNIDINKVLKGL